MCGLWSESRIRIGRLASCIAMNLDVGRRGLAVRIAIVKCVLRRYTLSVTDSQASVCVRGIGLWQAVNCANGILPMVVAES